MKYPTTLNGKPYPSLYDLDKAGVLPPPKPLEIPKHIDGHKVIEVQGLVNGKPTYASTFICEA